MNIINIDIFFFKSNRGPIFLKLTLRNNCDHFILYILVCYGSPNLRCEPQFALVVMLCSVLVLMVGVQLGRYCRYKDKDKDKHKYKCKDKDSWWVYSHAGGDFKLYVNTKQ